MDKFMILDWLAVEAKEFEDDFYEPDLDLKDALYEINDQREVVLPPSLPPQSEQMIPVLREHFKDNVTFISMFLNHYFPTEYAFYRVSTLEDEIFRGFDFFSDTVVGFTFPFQQVGRIGFERYITVNNALLRFAKTMWPKLKEPQGRLGAFLYHGLGRLFLERSDYNRYWIMATREENFAALDAGQDVRWSGRKEMQEGDIVFMYRTSPRKSITDIYQVKADPLFDLWGGWDGFWVDLEKVSKIVDISFSEMRRDQVLGQWSLVRQQFQGTMTEPVPHSIYNRLLEKIPEAIRSEHELKPEIVEEIGYSGEFAFENDFAAEVIVPILKRWGFRYQREYSCLFQLGVQPYHGRVDFYISDARGPLTLVETKLRILSDKALRLAVAQAKSYALMLGLPSFVVASPEGLWIYSLERNRDRLEKKVSSDNLKNYDEEVKNLLLKLRH